MRALVNYSPKPKSVEIREVNVPEVQDNEVLVRVKAASICGSDIHQYLGSHSWEVNYPVILGHEFCGVVEKSSSPEHPVGQRVTCETAARICGVCVYCSSGRYNLCPDRLGFGYGVDGAMADFVSVPIRCLHEIPDNIEFNVAALTEPCSVAYQTVFVNSEPPAGKSVAIIGPGTIGLLCLMVVNIIEPLITVAIGAPGDEARLDLAKKLGATESWIVGETDISEATNWIVDGLGFDLVIDAAGVSKSLETALSIVRAGGQITKVGWGAKPLDFSLDPLVRKNVRLQGSFSHTLETWESVLHLFSEQKLNPSPLIGKITVLDNWKECFESMISKEIIKGVLHP